MHFLAAAYARWKHQRDLNLDWKSHQERALARLLNQARRSRFAIDHELEMRASPKTYAERVPLRTYNELHRDYLTGTSPQYRDTLTGIPTRYLLLSSGTSEGIERRYPLTALGLRGFQQTAAAQVLSTVARLGHMRPMMRPFLSIADFSPLTPLESGVEQGAITQVLANSIPWFVQRKAVRLLGSELSVTERLDQLVERALRCDLGVLTGMTSWLLTFVERAKKLSGHETVRAIWPNLQVIGHGGVPARVYAPVMNETFSCGTKPFVLAESYAASEGYLAYGDAMLDGALRLSSHNGIFYEFIEVESYRSGRPHRVLAHEVEEGRNYVIAVTTPSGLWSHVIGDVVAFSDARLKTLKVLGRLSGSSEVWNEHITESDLDLAIESVRANHGIEVSHYHLGPRPYGDASGRGGYVLLVTLADDERHLKAADLGLMVDAELQRINGYFGKLRAPGGPIDAPEVHVVPAGFFESWMDERPGGGFQRKVPRVEGTGKVAAELVARLRS